MVSRLRLLTDDASPGAWNMAYDRALLLGVQRGHSPATLRFYRWSNPTVSVGYFQKVHRDFNVPLIRERGWGLVRRPSGGRGVLHWKEVTFSLVLKTGGRGLWEIFRLVHEAIGRGLEEGGIPARLLPADRDSLFSRENQKKHHNASCFASPSRYELTLGGKKLCGTAQWQVGDSILVHGSLPMESTCRELFEVMSFEDPDAREDAFRRASGRMTSIYEGTRRHFAFEDLCRFMTCGFFREWNAVIEPGEYNDFEKTIAREYAGKADESLEI